MKSFYFFILFVIVLSIGYSQNKTKIVTGTNGNTTTENYFSLNNDLIEEINLARTEPQRYARFLEDMLPGFEGKKYKLAERSYLITHEGKDAVLEAIRFLKTQTPLNKLSLSNSLSKAAADHVEDTGPGGLVGHKGKSGERLSDRIDKYCSNYLTLSECISYGENTARGIIIQLIIDDNVKDRGHRKIIFSDDVNRVGFAFGYHKTYKYMCVIDFCYCGCE